MMSRGLILLAVLLAVGCTPAARAAHPPAARPAERTVRVAADRFAEGVTVKVGDVLVVERPARFDEWDVAFSSDVLKSLNTEAGRRRPPATGWTFAVVARGTTDISFTPFLPRGGTPNVPKYVITVTAQ